MNTDERVESLSNPLGNPADSGSYLRIVHVADGDEESEQVRPTRKPDGKSKGGRPRTRTGPRERSAKALNLPLVRREELRRAGEFFRRAKGDLSINDIERRVHERYVRDFIAQGMSRQDAEDAANVPHVVPHRTLWQRFTAPDTLVLQGDLGFRSIDDFLRATDQDWEMFIAYLRTPADAERALETLREREQDAALLNVLHRLDPAYRQLLRGNARRYLEQQEDEERVREQMKRDIERALRLPPGLLPGGPAAAPDDVPEPKANGANGEHESEE